MSTAIGWPSAFVLILIYCGVQGSTSRVAECRLRSSRLARSVPSLSPTDRNASTISVIAVPGPKYARTPAQILFRYLTQNDVVPLTGTTSVAHMREDLAIFEFRLTDAELAAVNGLL